MLPPSSSSLLWLSCVCLLAGVSCKPISAFLPTTSNNSRRSSTSLNIFGPETIGIAMVSAAAGAVSQQPKIQELESELAKATASLETSKEKMVQKIEELEEKLFQMDLEYEGQSAKFQKEYDERKKVEVERISEKIKNDFRYKLEIEMEKEKGRMLSKKLDEDTNNADQTNKLTEMRLEKQELEMVKTKLEFALSKSDKELERLKESPKSKGGFWPF